MLCNNKKLLTTPTFLPDHIGMDTGWDIESEFCLFLSLFICEYVYFYLLILLQFCQSRGGIISDLCRSQSLGTSHSLFVQEEDESSLQRE